MYCCSLIQASIGDIGRLQERLSGQTQLQNLYKYMVMRTLSDHDCESAVQPPVAELLTQYVSQGKIQEYQLEAISRQFSWLQLDEEQQRNLCRNLLRVMDQQVESLSKQALTLVCRLLQLEGSCVR